MNEKLKEVGKCVICPCTMLCFSKVIRYLITFISKQFPNNESGGHYGRLIRYNKSD